MRNHISISKTFVFAITMIVSVLMPEVASAKWSKASRKFTCNGVSVEVTDRRHQIGKVHHNTYGYTTFINRNDETVTVGWKCIGVLKKNGKLVLIKDDSIILAPGEKMGQVYSYHVGHYQLNDFKEYLASIEVTKAKSTKPTATTPGEASGAINKSNSDKVYARLAKKMEQDSFTQEDYSQAIDWLTYTFNTTLKPLYEKGSEYIKQGDRAAAERMIKGHEELAENWSKLGTYVRKADKANKLNAENHARWTEFSKLITRTLVF